MSDDHRSSPAEGIDLVRAWKDESYRAHLPQDVRDRLPAPPDNLHNLSDAELAEVVGAVPWAVAARELAAPAAAVTGLATLATGFGLSVGGMVVAEEKGPRLAPKPD